MKVAIELDLRPSLGPIRDQRHLPTCLAFAVTAAHEHALASGVDLSPAHIYLQAGDPGLEHGVSVESVREVLASPGQALEVDCPYGLLESDLDWRPPAGVPFFRSNSATLSPTPANLVSALESQRVPVLGITVPGTFLSPCAPWLISPGNVVGGLHAVAGVGLGLWKRERCVLVRNSWGSAWGDAGHAWLSETFVREHLHDLVVLTGALP